MFDVIKEIGEIFKYFSSVKHNFVRAWKSKWEQKLKKLKKIENWKQKLKNLKKIDKLKLKSVKKLNFQALNFARESNLPFKLPVKISVKKLKAPIRFNYEAFDCICN